MYRREVLRRLATVGAVATLAGCSSEASTRRDAPRPPEPPEGGGPSEEPIEGLEVAEIDYRVDDSGNLLVLVTVRNGGGESRSGTLTTTVTLGGESLAESTEVTVGADNSEEIEVPFEASFADFERNGSIKLDLE